MCSQNELRTRHLGVVQLIREQNGALGGEFPPLGDCLGKEEVKGVVRTGELYNPAGSATALTPWPI